MAKILNFKCTPEKCLYNSDNFKIYACSINSFEYPDIKLNKYDNITLKGDITELNLGIEYTVTAEEKDDKYGMFYDVKNVKREIPTGLQSTQKFLQEILTENQARELLKAYPNIVYMVMNNEPVDLTKVYGIGEASFERIKTKITENFKLVEIVEEFKGLFSLTIVKKLYENYTSLDKLKEKLREDPYMCLCKLGGVGFKTADSLLLTLYKDFEDCKTSGEKPSLYFLYSLPDSIQRAKSCVYYLLTENEANGHTYMEVKDLKKQFDVLVPEAKHNLGIILKTDENVVFDRERLIVSSKRAYDTEKDIARMIKEGLKTVNEKDWNCDYSKFTVLDGFKLTEEQSNVTKMMCQSNIGLLIGFGGSGKTSSTQAFINMLDAYKKTYLLLAPTGRASKVLAAFTGKKAQTIHRGIGYTPPNEWCHKKDLPFDEEIVIVDEFSMVDIFLFQKLLDAIDFTKTKLLIIGDSAQIPSVSAGNTLFDLVNSKIIPTTTLSKVFRYGTGGLSTIATDIRNSQEFLDTKNNSLQFFGEDKSYVFCPIPQERIKNYVVKLYTGLLAKGYAVEDIAVLSSYNVGEYGTVELNRVIQAAVNNTKERVKYGDTEFRVGDIITATKNDYYAEVYAPDIDPKKLKKGEKMPTTFIANGQTGKIIEKRYDTLIVQFDDQVIQLCGSILKNYKLAYAISTHRSQGGEFKAVILVTPKAHTFMLNSNLLYVGVSRAKQTCFHVGEARTVNLALKKKENYDRKTLLLEFLQKEDEDGL